MGNLQHYECQTSTEIVLVGAGHVGAMAVLRNRCSAH